MIYQISDLKFDPDRRELSRDGAPIHLTKLNFRVLRALVEAAPGLLKHDELIDQVWGENRVITPENLTQRIKVLREALGDDANQPIYIEAVRGQGFRLLPEAEAVAAEPSSTPPMAPAKNQRRLFGLSLVATVVALLTWFISERFTAPDDTSNNKSVVKSLGKLPRIDLLQGLSVAVLPFVNMSEDPSNEYFSDGISEEIINTLVQQTKLPIIARTSSFQFKNQQVDGKDIGEKLGATHLLEGSVRKSGHRVRITAQLIDAPSGVHLWSEQYDRSVDDLFEIQTEIAAKIVNKIKQQLNAQGEDRIQGILQSVDVSPSGAMNGAAYQAYLKGLQHLHRLLPDDVALAQEYFEEATRLAPESEQAWLALIKTDFVATVFHISISTPAESYARIERWLETALPLFPDNVFLQATHGIMLAFNQYRWKEGLEQMDQAVELADNDASTLELLGVYYFFLAQQELATELLEKALRLDPHSPITSYILSFLYSEGGRQEEALALPQPKGYDYFNAVTSATINIMLGRAAEIDQSIREAKKHVPADHPTIRSLESQWLSVKDDNESALVIENELIDNMREVPITVGWVAPVRLEALIIAEEQRQGNPLQWIMLRLAQGWPLGERLSRFPEKMNLDEMPERKRGRSQLLSQAEQQAILNSGISVPVSRLQSYVGLYRSGDNMLEISLDEGQLQYQGKFWGGLLSAVSENTFVSTDERDFSVEILANKTGEYDLCVWRDGQLTMYGYKEDTAPQ